MALAELVREGSMVDRDRSSGPAVDVTLVIEATTPAMPAVSPRAPVGEVVSDPYVPGDGRATVLQRHCGPARTPDGDHLHPETAGCWLCDPVITALIVDSLGVPLDLGRQVRLATHDQRRALKHRDGGCVFPGCDAPVGWCDAHLVVPWVPIGRNDTSNLALLCRYHHGV
ncbi:MAG: HNH endonuclease signature motif containing protein, partial [Acidimicrobiales bacterium]